MMVVMVITVVVMHDGDGDGDDEGGGSDDDVVDPRHKLVYLALKRPKFCKSNSTVRHSAQIAGISSWRDNTKGFWFW